MADGRRGEHGGGLVGDACGETTSSVLRGEATSSGPRGGRRPPVGGGGAGWLGDLPSVEVEARSTEGRPGRLDPTEVRPGRLDPAEARPRRQFRWRDGRGCGLRWRGVGDASSGGGGGQGGSIRRRGGRAGQEVEGAAPGGSWRGSRRREGVVRWVGWEEAGGELGGERTSAARSMERGRRRRVVGVGV